MSTWGQISRRIADHHVQHRFDSFRDNARYEHSISDFVQVFMDNDRCLLDEHMGPNDTAHSRPPRPTPRRLTAPKPPQPPPTRQEPQGRDGLREQPTNLPPPVSRGTNLRMSALPTSAIAAAVGGGSALRDPAVSRNTSAAPVWARAVANDARHPGAHAGQAVEEWQEVWFAVPLDIYSCIALLCMYVCMCYNIENVKEQHQGEAERQSIQR